jgi:hypothetical protein
MVILINIGEFCFWTFLLKYIKKRYTAYPFDWMFSNLLFIIDQIDNNFEEFYKMINYVNQNSFSIYETECFQRPSIPHKNLNLLEDREYYKRTIARFIDTLNSNEKIIFLHINGKLDRYCEDSLLKFHSCIKKNYPNLNFKIISMYFKQNYKLDSNFIEEKMNNNGIICWTFYLKETIPDLSNWFNYAANPILITKLNNFIDDYSQ